MHVKLLQWCPSLCDPMDCSPPGSSVHGILWARILQWVALPSSSRSSWPRDRTHVSCKEGRLLTPGPPGKPPVYQRAPQWHKPPPPPHRAKVSQLKHISSPELRNGEETWGFKVGRWAWGGVTHRIRKKTDVLLTSKSELPGRWNFQTKQCLWYGTSLVVQWLRIRVARQGTPVGSLIWKDPTCHGATKPLCPRPREAQ